MDRVVNVNFPRLGATLALSRASSQLRADTAILGTMPREPQTRVFLVITSQRWAHLRAFGACIARGLACPLLEIGAQHGTILHDPSSHPAIDFGAPLKQGTLLVNFRSKSNGQTTFPVWGGETRGRWQTASGCTRPFSFTCSGSFRSLPLYSAVRKAMRLVVSQRLHGDKFLLRRCARRLARDSMCWVAGVTQPKNGNSVQSRCALGIPRQSP